MGDLSPHFSRWEFRDHYTGELIDPPTKLLNILEAIRRELGRPVRIVSGYRSPSTNRRVGGARRSQHLLGTAVDLEEGVTTASRARSLGATGVGTRGKWAVHLDVRRGPYTHWTYD